MLAARVTDESQIRYPAMVSPKLDGIRCLIVNCEPVTRNLKPIRNLWIYRQLLKLPYALDGELMVSGGFSNVASGVMSQDGHPDFEYHVFDILPSNMRPDMPYFKRYKYLSEIMKDLPKFVKLVPHNWIIQLSQLRDYEEQYLSHGYEGIMIRDINGPYKYGRSTLNEGYLLKLKRFEDSEAVVVNAVERFHNGNPQERDELGRSKRSSAQSGMIPAGDLGALVCKDMTDGTEVQLGSGFTAEQRRYLWKQHTLGVLVGRIAKYKFQPTVKDKPRFPIFLGFRDKEDM